MGKKEATDEKKGGGRFEKTKKNKKKEDKGHRANPRRGLRTGEEQGNERKTEKKIERRMRGFCGQLERKTEEGQRRKMGGGRTKSRAKEKLRGIGKGKTAKGICKTWGSSAKEGKQRGLRKEGKTKAAVERERELREATEQEKKGKQNNNKKEVFG